MPDLRDVTSTDDDLATFVTRHASVVTEFGPRTQDSGNISWLVEADGRRLFVKTAGRDAPPEPGDPVPFFDLRGRVALLRTAVELARSCDHPALPRLLNVIESPAGPALVYEAAVGELVGVSSERRSDPASPYRRFARLAAVDQLQVFDQLFDLHRQLAALGWVACDLYDGCLIVDLPRPSLTVVDLDTYRRGPSVNDMGRMFGSTRFMAPEELELGAPLDQRTTVFTLGRLAWHFGTRLTEQAAAFCGPPALAEVVDRAVCPDRAARFPTVAAFVDAWDAIRQ